MHKRVQRNGHSNQSATPRFLLHHPIAFYPVIICFSSLPASLSVKMHVPINDSMHSLPKRESPHGRLWDIVSLTCVSARMENHCFSASIPAHGAIWWHICRDNMMNFHPFIWGENAR